MEVALALLNLHFIDVYATFVDAYGSTRLHATYGDTVACDGFGESVRCRLGHTSPRELHTTYMEQTVEEGTCGDYDTFGVEGHAPHGVYTDDFAILYK